MAGRLVTITVGAEGGRDELFEDIVRELPDKVQHQKAVADWVTVLVTSPVVAHTIISVLRAWLARARGRSVALHVTDPDRGIDKHISVTGENITETTLRKALGIADRL